MKLHGIGELLATDIRATIDHTRIIIVIIIINF